jgi:hypothetical protein
VSRSGGAAAQGGFDADRATASRPLEGRWTAGTPARYSLYGLKTLAFIRLGGGAGEKAREILQAQARPGPGVQWAGR